MPPNVKNGKVHGSGSGHNFSNFARKVQGCVPVQFARAQGWVVGRCVTAHTESMMMSS